MMKIHKRIRINNALCYECKKTDFADNPSKLRLDSSDSHLGAESYADIMGYPIIQGVIPYHTDLLIDDRLKSLTGF